MWPTASTCRRPHIGCWLRMSSLQRECGFHGCYHACVSALLMVGGRRRLVSSRRETACAFGKKCRSCLTVSWVWVKRTACTGAERWAAAVATTTAISVIGEPPEQLINNEHVPRPQFVRVQQAISTSTRVTAVDVISERRKIILWLRSTH